MNLKPPFFSRKNLIFVIGGTVILYTLVGGGVIAEHWLHNNRIAQVKKVQQEKFNNLSKAEKSIIKAQGRLVDSISQVGTSERIFLAYVQRKFDLPATLGEKGPVINLSEDPATYPNQINYLARIAYADKVIKEQPKYGLDEDGKVTNIFSANCDHIPLPDFFWPTMERSTAAGGYLATHVALALSMMKDNGCSFPPEADTLKNRVTAEMVDFAGDASTLADLRYESIAFLMLGKRRDLIQSKWIDQIIAEQQPDGGWSRAKGDTKDDYHSTVLSLWALLEYSRPNTPDQPLIRRPKG